MAPDAPLPVSSRIRNRYLFASDLVLFASATIIAFALRFEGFEQTCPEGIKHGE